MQGWRDPDGELLRRQDRRNKHAGSEVVQCKLCRFICAAESDSEGVKLKKGKSGVGSVSKSWSFSDPELQRKKRVAGYKVYAVEGW
ncbi:hypothetical protein SLA2020_435620 [Shorea laevis]